MSLPTYFAMARGVAPSVSGNGQHAPARAVPALEMTKWFDSNYHYPNAIGPGVYDIHSPQIPSVASIQHLLQKALEVLQPEQLWVNPDCGLKTRNWPEVREALHNMVTAAQRLREQLHSAKTPKEFCRDK